MISRLVLKCVSITEKFKLLIPLGTSDHNCRQNFSLFYGWHTAYNRSNHLIKEIKTMEWLILFYSVVCIPFQKKYRMQDTLGWTGTLVLKCEGNIQIKTKICRKLRHAKCLTPTGRWTSRKQEKQLLSAIVLAFFLTDFHWSHFTAATVHQVNKTAVAIWPVIGQGFQNTKWSAVLSQ